jgi:protease II
VNPEEVLCFSIKNTSTNKYDMMVYYKDFEYESEQWQQALFVILENVLGEYNFAVHVGTVDFMKTADVDIAIRNKLQPITSFAKVL